MTTETQEFVADLSATPSESTEVKEVEPNTPNATAADGDVETKEQVKDERKFSQAEVDALVQKRLLKEERRVHRRVEQQLREQSAERIAQVEPKRESFADESEFTRAQVEHLAEKRAMEKLAERELAKKAEQQTESFIEKAEKASERYADFNAVVSNPSLRIDEKMVEFISESDHGADVAYYLGKNTAKAAEIAGMSPMQAARALLAIESEIAAKPKVSLSKAPEPINPVGTRGKASSSSLPSDEDDIDTWMKKERARTQRR